MTDPNGQRCGFFEESPGVRSSTRLIMFILAACVVALTGATCWYLVRPKMAPDASVISAMALLIGALVLNGIVAIRNRNSGE